MATFRKDKKEEEEEGDGMDLFRKLDKSIILQEVQYFNSNQVNGKKCILILSKTLIMLNQGVHLTTEEATTIFFAITRLFQSKDVMMRKLVYLSIKELSSLAQNVFIVSSSITKDMSGKEDLIRAAAIRTQRSITDNSMLLDTEKYMKQAILDKNPAVSSAALVSALHLTASAPDLVQRWLKEAQVAVTSDNMMVTYHALGVISASRHDDRLFMVKLVNKLLQRPIQSPYTVCLLIRHAAKLAANETEDSKSYLEFIESCLFHRSEIVIYEAAHAVVSLSQNIRDLTQAVSALQIFCVSSKASTRLAGARTLAQVTAKHPKAVIVCTVDLENLIFDSNRSVATLAITTLLANCTECSIERLIKRISSFLSEISDEFKIVVVGAIKNLCSKYPRKQQFLVSLLSDMLRAERDEEHKMAIANAIISLIEENSDAKEIGLSHLCEFIEDSHQEALAVRVLHVIGREGPKVRQPSRFIRFIYNRILLNSEPVRAAAVTAVAQFGAACADLLPSIKVLLDRCQTDDDDEVRDRATFYSAIFDSEDQKLINNYISNVPIYNFVLLEEALQNHLNTHPDQSFNMDTVPIVKDKKVKDKLAEIEPFQVTVVSLEEQYANQLKVIPYIAKLGPVFKTCEPIELTEPETEYQVKCIKHIYAKHLILQFECMNTLFSHLLKEVHICLDLAPEYNLICEVPCESLPYEKKGNIFCVLEFPKSPLNSVACFGAVLEFSVYDCDSTTGKPYPGGCYTDTYTLEAIEIGCKEQFKIQPASDDWEVTWESAESQKEVIDTFVINNFDVTRVATAMCKHLALPESSVKGDDIKKICGLGTWRTGIPVIFSARMVPSLSGVTMLLTVRSPSEAVATLLLAAIE